MRSPERLIELIMDAAEMCSAAIWVNISTSAPPPTVDDNGTCAFVDTGEKKLLITAYHVLAKFRKEKARNAAAGLCVCLGRQSVFLDSPRVLDEDESTLDLAVIEFTHLENLSGQQKRYFPIRKWPIPTAASGDAITLIGFPGAFRFTHPSFGAFEPAGLAFTVSSVSDRNIVLADETGTRRTKGGRLREDEGIPFGGFSGAPAFLFRDDMFHLVGFMRGGSKETDKSPIALPGVVFLSPATYLQIDGTFDRHRMPLFIPRCQENSE
jgi:hypothetical protein